MEGRVRTLDEVLHVDLLLEHREPFGVQLREVEHVADEPREAFRLVGDRVEGHRPGFLVLDEPLAQCRDVPANGGERRAKLVRDRHEEVALELLGLAEPAGHFAEALGEMPDLAAARNGRNGDVVMAERDLVGHTREVQDGAGQPT